MGDKNEIILYQSDELAERIEVRLEDETVWLNQEQLSSLFQRDQSVISRHIRNVFKEGELEEKSNMQKMHIPNSDKPVAFYNLDVIISVGYRVKSKQGTQFRIWATNVLRDYLLKGYALNQRMNRIENNFENLSREVRNISLQIKTNELPRQGIFFDGQIFDAYVFVADLIKHAKKSIISKQLRLDLKKHNSQYPEIKVVEFKEAHDRFLVLDEKECYHFGASLNDLGKKPVVSEVEPWFAFSKMEGMTGMILDNLQKVKIDE